MGRKLPLHNELLFLMSWSGSIGGNFGTKDPTQHADSLMVSHDYKTYVVRAFLSMHKGNQGTVHTKEREAFKDAAKDQLGRITFIAEDEGGGQNGGKRDIGSSQPS